MIRSLSQPAFASSESLDVLSRAILAGDTTTVLSLPQTVVYLNRALTYGGATSTPTTAGHTLSVVAVRYPLSNVCRVDILLERQGGIHHALATPLAVSAQRLALLPAAFWPGEQIRCVGGASTADGKSGQNALTWGGFALSATGELRQFAPDSATTTITGAERITGVLWYVAGGLATDGYSGDFSG